MLGLLLAGGYAGIVWRSVSVGCRHCDGVPGGANLYRLAEFSL